MKLQLFLIAGISIVTTGLAISMFAQDNGAFSGGTASPLPPEGASTSALTIALQRDPENVILLKRLARAHRQAGNQQAAIESYLAVARITPSDAESNNALRAMAGR